jgi:hypothetical protein
MQRKTFFAPKFLPFPRVLLVKKTTSSHFFASIFLPFPPHPRCRNGERGKKMGAKRCKERHFLLQSSCHSPACSLLRRQHPLIFLPPFFCHSLRTPAAGTGKRGKKMGARRCKERHFLLQSSCHSPACSLLRRQHPLIFLPPFFCHLPPSFCHSRCTPADKTAKCGLTDETHR